MSDLSKTTQVIRWGWKSNGEKRGWGKGEKGGGVRWNRVEVGKRWWGEKKSRRRQRMGVEGRVGGKRLHSSRVGYLEGAKGTVLGPCPGILQVHFIWQVYGRDRLPAWSSKSFCLHLVPKASR